MSSWPTVATSPSFPSMEEEVLERWREHDVFHASLRRRADGPIWTFYEGPPTANGLPGTHHVEARTFKDIFPRYRTMKGHLVPRKGGWDCHGLPVEIQIERELGLDSKADIEAFGIEQFNRLCRESVTRYVEGWERLTERIGFWVDLADAYWTMAPEYVDSLWWALKQLWDRGLVFEDFRVAPYCARCGTGLSDAEVAMGYETVDDPSIYVRFPVLDGPLAERGAALLIWTTTPWTLSNNAAVVVGPDVAYELVDTGEELLVIAAERRVPVLGESAQVVDELSADDLAGLHYEAPFTFTEYEQDQRYVVIDPYVTTTEGTGLVHISPGFGAEDHAIVKREGLEIFIPVDLAGQFTHGPWAGTFVRDADPLIIQELERSGRLLRAETYTHTYPFCWRCGRPLIYYAKPSWYIRTTAHKEDLLANNASIGWYPEHIRAGRFGNWLENNVDWALSRDRYWGTPLPFWRCTECNHVTVVGSRAELGEVTGQDQSDLDPHRPYVDEIVVPCQACGSDARRVPDVADAWFDSGAMPFAQWGYPHEGAEEFERHFPAQFIAEAIDQTRGWFYTLLAEATLLFGTSSYETVLCLGHIVDEEGRKMSKSLGNILDPWGLIERHGADALRWLMLAEGNPWVNRRVGHHLLDDVVRRFLLTLWNTHVFFTTYARIDGFTLDDPTPPVSDRPAMDRWVLAELAELVDTVDRALDGYDVSTATRRLEAFVDDLSNWYVRRSRRRFWRAASDDPADKAAAYETLHTCLRTLAGLLAPFTPFVSDMLWHDLVVTVDETADVSVHLTDFPSISADWRDEQLRTAMASARRLVELGRQARTDAGMRVRQPLARALVTVPSGADEAVRELLPEVAEELNVKVVELADGTRDLVELRLSPRFQDLGPVFKDRAQAVGSAIRETVHDDAVRIASELAAAGTARLLADGAEVEISEAMVDVVETARPGWAVAADRGWSLALDTTLTDELRIEAAARELVRAVNDLRKEGGLALDDRIVLSLHVTPPALQESLSSGGWIDLLSRETLAVEVETSGDGTTVPLGELGTATVSIRPA